jgi:hypothetical protein
MSKLEFEGRRWEDRTGGVLEVERWDDGDVIFRSVGIDPTVCLQAHEVAEVLAFIKGTE